MFFTSPTGTSGSVLSTVLNFARAQRVLKHGPYILVRKEGSCSTLVVRRLRCIFTDPCRCGSWHFLECIRRGRIILGHFYATFLKRWTAVCGSWLYSITVTVAKFEVIAPVCLKPNASNFAVHASLPLWREDCQDSRTVHPTLREHCAQGTHRDSSGRVHQYESC